MLPRIGPTTSYLLLRLRTRQVLAVLGLLAMGTAAFAQADPPSRVGRLSDIAGSVFLAPEDTDNSWQPIGLNYPVTTGDSVWVSQDGRAEIDFGAGQIRLSDEANVHFSVLDDRQFSAYLASGRAILQLRVLDPSETAKLDTGNAQIDILRPGNFRVDATADGLYTRLVVRDGEAELRVADRATMVLAGQTAVIDGSGYGAVLAIRDGYDTDDFDAWSADRDRHWQAGGISSRYVSSYVPGVNDLDSYGVWETTPTYGAVWYPRAVAADWVPYRDGNWTFVSPWGWTWVDSAPWGWAPFHYGRWVRHSGRWGWCPGTFVAHPVYAPALVAWYGGPAGTSWSVGFGGPTFGWVPLAWGEPYWPHHRHTADYWRSINRPYAVNVSRVPAKPLPAFAYANARIPGAVTAVSRDVLTGRRPISGNRYAVPAAALAGAALTTTRLAVRPITQPLPTGSLPRGIPVPAASLGGRSGSGRPDFRAPSVPDGRPVTGRPGGGGDAFREPAPGSGRPGVSPPPVVSRPAIREPNSGTGRATIGAPPTVGRPSTNGPAPGVARPATREPGSVIPDPRQSGGKVFTPPAQPLPGARRPDGESAPTVGRPSVREPAPYNPGLRPAQPAYTPPARPPAPVVRDRSPMTQQYNPGLNSGQGIAPPPRPTAPVVREPARMTPQSNPGFNARQSAEPPPRPAAPAAREPAGMIAPAAVVDPAPAPGRPVRGRPAADAKLTEPQIPAPRVAGPGSR